jgi:hypothetical protein
MQCYQGTPVFIARAVQAGNAVPLSGALIVPTVPNSPELYALNHPDRIKKFPPGGVELVIRTSMHSNSRQWRHELNHDAESVFWLLFFWVVGAPPMGCPPEAINPTTWTNLTDSVQSHISLIKALSAGEINKGTTHSVYQPVQPLLIALAAILVVDRFWLEESDTRNDPEYVCEAFQRLILQFLLDNHNEAFLRHKVETCCRDIGAFPQVPSLTETTGQKRNAESTGK